jgi:hypothetical protein
MNTFKNILVAMVIGMCIAVPVMAIIDDANVTIPSNVTVDTPVDLVATIPAVTADAPVAPVVTDVPVAVPVSSDLPTLVYGDAPAGSEKITGIGIVTPSTYMGSIPQSHMGTLKFHLPSGNNAKFQEFGLKNNDYLNTYKQFKIAQDGTFEDVFIPGNFTMYVPAGYWGPEQIMSVKIVTGQTSTPTPDIQG